MSIVHLSELEIQEYLDTNIHKEKVENHILACEECAVALAEYQSFYKELSVDETPQLSVDFVSQTMHAVREESIILDNNKGFYMFSILGLVLAFYLVRYYVGFNNFSLPKLSMPQFSNVFADWSIFNTAATYYQSSPNIVNLILFAGMILLFFALVDSVMSRRNLGKISCFSI